MKTQSLVLSVVLMAGAPLMPAFAASSVTFTNDALIGLDNTNFDGLEVVITNCTVTLDGNHTFANLRILDGGVLTHSYSTNGLLATRVVVRNEAHEMSDTNPPALNRANVYSNTIVVTDITGSITYAPGVDYELSSFGVNNFQLIRLGGSAIQDGATILVNYETAGQPRSAGLFLTVSNDLAIEFGGAINADAKGYGGDFGPGAGASRSTNSPYPHAAGGGGGHIGSGGSSSTQAPGGNSVGNQSLLGSGGGAGSGPGGAGGGSVVINVSGELKVDGQMRVNGADGANPGSGGGAGGSIRLTVQGLSGSGRLSADGGAGEPYDGGGGGGGFISVEYKSSRFTGSISAFGGAGAVHGGAGLVYTKAQEADFGHLVIDNGGREGTNTLPLFFQTSDLTVSGGAIAILATGRTFSNLRIGSKSWLEFSSGEINSKTLTITGDATIEESSGIRLDGQGFSSGPGSPPPGSSSGAGHGGIGGNGLTNSGAGPSYGSVVFPATVGSGCVNSSAGGGSLKLFVSGALLLRGQISAQGTQAINAGGGGSGGSLWLTVGKISGTGLLSADGAAGDLEFGGGGGGGRIALYYGTNEFAGNISARGGAGANFGGAGTIYLKQQAARMAEIIVDNDGNAGAPTPLPTLVDSFNNNLKITGRALINVSGMLSSYDLSIGFGSWLVHTNQTGLSIQVRHNATIEAGGGILLDGRTYFQGPGSAKASSGIGDTFSGGGGGYGGYGGASFFRAAGGNSYGSLLSPTDPGSGGGVRSSFSEAQGGAGGGALHLDVLGTLAVDGAISANGRAGLSSGNGGGSGGGLWLSAGTLSGAGMISANGGDGDLPYGGGGGGGRIAIYCRTNLFTGQISAHGGAGAVCGGAGTIYFKASNVDLAQVILDNSGCFGTNTPLPGPRDGTITRFDLMSSGGAVATLSSNANTLRTLWIGSNSWITLSGSVGSRGVVAENATIQQGGGIVALAGSQSGRGRGPGSVTNSAPYGITGAGGGYGGRGGASAGGARGGESYGSALEPHDFGSSGGAAIPPSTQFDAPGGGALRLTVAGTLVLDGALLADGSGALRGGGGGGSGGSIWLKAGKLSGAGFMSASGGSGDSLLGGGGSGGRIAVYYGVSEFAGSLAAHGGAGAHSGGAGTIYLRDTSQSVGQIVIDNGGKSGASTPLSVPEAFQVSILNGAVVSPSWPTLVLSSLTIGSNAILAQLPSQTNLDILVLGDVSVGTSGWLSANGSGYNGTSAGPGAGQMDPGGSGSGAGYGGAGGASASGTPGGLAYGSVQQPIDPGSRGGLYPVYPNFCEGGGAIRLRVAGTLTLAGKLSASGHAALFESAGGGAGGSIWVTARKLEGDGIIEADGGAGDPPEGGGGGGGRIALYSTANSFAGPITVLGGAGSSRGQDGTVWITNPPAPAVLAQSPSNVVFYSVNAIELIFDSPLDTNSVALSAIQVATPNGVLPRENLSIVIPNWTTLQVGFPAQSTLGFYEIRLGAPLTDLFGAPLAYTGSFVILPPVISGKVVDSQGAPIPYVTLRAGEDFLPAITDEQGAFSLEVAPSWAGTITPSKGALRFIPASRTYTNVTANLTNQNFVMVSPAELALTSEQHGNVLSLAWPGIEGAKYQFFYSINLVDWLPYEGPLGGTNGPMRLNVPLGLGPSKFFFRFAVSY